METALNGAVEPEPPRPVVPADLDATLDQLQRLCGRLEQAESRFKQLTDECEGVLKGLVAVDRRHSSVIAGLNDRLGEWCHIESRMLEESARRIEQFERGVGHEWMVLRQLHEEPLAQLKDDADQLRMACLEAARTARFRFDAVEKAYTSYAADMERRLTEWSRELLGAVAGARGPNGTGQPALPGPTTPALPAAAPAAALQPWPLEGVAQLHQEIRAEATPAPPPASLRARLAPSPRVVVFSAAAIVLVALGGYALLRPAASPSPVARPGAAAQAATASTPPAGDERLAEAQRAADRAGAMVDILAAADLRRYALAGVSPTAAAPPYGQVLWSRSRGLAANASRLPQPPDGKVYRLWIVPDGPPVAAGVLTRDAAGRATLLIAGPLTLPVPVTIRVTLEDEGEVTTPRGPVCLARVPGA
jgi:hypothetical protein